MRKKEEFTPAAAVRKLQISPYARYLDYFQLCLLCLELVSLLLARWVLCQQARTMVLIRGTQAFEQVTMDAALVLSHQALLAHSGQHIDQLCSGMLVVRNWRRKRLDLRVTPYFADCSRRKRETWLLRLAGGQLRPARAQENACLYELASVAAPSFAR